MPQTPAPPLPQIRIDRLCAMLVRMVGYARGMMNQHREGNQITNRMARRIRKHIYVVECALRRLLVLIAFGIEVAPAHVSTQKEKLRNPTQNLRKITGICLSELPQLPLNTAREHVRPFWESLSPDCQDNPSTRSTDRLCNKMESILFVLENLERYAKMMARRKANSKAKNYLGLLLFISPGGPHKKPPTVTTDEWREYGQLHIEGMNLMRAWWRELSGRTG